MPAYEYVCLACEHLFEERRSITASVETALACPDCGSDRVRRRFSVFSTGAGLGGASASTGGCACGGACACGAH